MPEHEPHEPAGPVTEVAGPPSRHPLQAAAGPMSAARVMALQRSAGNAAVARLLAARRLSRWPVTTSGVDLGPIIAEAVHTALTQALTGPADAAFGEALGNAVANALPAEVTQEQRTGAAARARALGSTTTGTAPDQHTIPSALQALRRASDSGSEGAGAPPALGPGYFQKGLERDIVTGVSNEIADPGNQIPRVAATNNVAFDLGGAVEAASNPRRLNELELEATVVAMLEERAAAEAATDPAEKAAHGARLGEMGRRCLLLNHAIATAQNPAPDQTALETQMLQNAGRRPRCGAPRRPSGDRHRAGRRSRAAGPAAGDPATAVLRRAVPDATPAVDVRPEEALPATTDHAERQLAGGMRDQIGTQRAQTGALRDQIIPSPPTYTLPEFGAVYRRWSGFHNPAEEENDPQVKLLLSLVEGPNSAYTMAGMDGMEGMSAASGGIARAMLMNFVAGELEGKLHHGQSADFAGVIDAQRLRRNDSAVTGTASDPRYSTAGTYGGGTETGGVRAERASRTTTAARGAADERRCRPPGRGRPARPAARRRRADRPDTAAGGAAVPILGARAPQAEEGWTYLMDVDAMSEENPEPHLVARQQRTMSPEVAAYLLAARQQQQTLAEAHHPAVDGGTGGAPTAVGGAGMRAAASRARRRTPPPRSRRRHRPPSPRRSPDWPPLARLATPGRRAGAGPGERRARGRAARA